MEESSWLSVFFAPCQGLVRLQLWLDVKAAICFYVSMKTTVVLPDGIFRRAKAETAMRGRTLRAFILDAVVHELDGASRDASVRRRVKLPLVRSSRPGSLKITADTIAEAMLTEDVHAHT